MYTHGRVAFVYCMKGDDALLAFAHQKKSTAGVSVTEGCRVLTFPSLFVVSSGDVCGKKTNPCGEDAICNQTNVNAICQCKSGFKRNQKTGQCEGELCLIIFFSLLLFYQLIVELSHVLSLG